MSVSKDELLKVVGAAKESEPMAKHSTFMAGGKAAYLVSAENTAELINLLRLLKSKNEKFTLLGGGSNVLFAADFYDGVVITLGRDFKKISSDGGGAITAGGAARLAALCAMAVKEGLAGLEAVAGIPGTVGGALAGNAGTSSGAISDCLEKVTIIDDAPELKTVVKSETAFGYRKSPMAGKIVTEAVFRLGADKPSEILKRINSHLAGRAGKHPRQPSAGSVFKNPPSGPPAGKLIEDCGLKGHRAGGAEISSAHANFIINSGNASAKDILELMNLAASRVREKFGIALEPEIKIIL